jgi:ankyrin repeat protein
MINDSSNIDPELLEYLNSDLAMSEFLQFGLQQEPVLSANVDNSRVNGVLRNSPVRYDDSELVPLSSSLRPDPSAGNTHLGGQSNLPSSGSALDEFQDYLYFPDNISDDLTLFPPPSSSLATAAASAAWRINSAYIGRPRLEREREQFSSFANNSSPHRSLASSAASVASAPLPDVYDWKLFCQLDTLTDISGKCLTTASSSTSLAITSRELLCSCLPSSCSSSYYTLCVKINDETRYYRLIIESGRTLPSARGVNSSKGRTVAASSGGEQTCFSLKPLPSKQKKSKGKDPPSSSSTSSSSTTALHSLWEFPDYYGSQVIEITVFQHFRFSFQSKKVIAKKSVLAKDLYDKQRSQEKERRYLCKENSYDWLIHHVVEFDVPASIPSSAGSSGSGFSSSSSTAHGVHRASSSSSSSGLSSTSSAMNVNWLLNGGKPKFSQPKHSSYSSRPSTDLPAIAKGGPSSGNSCSSLPSDHQHHLQPTSKLKLSFCFRMIFLSKCMRTTVTTDYLVPDSSSLTFFNSSYLMSEFHILLAKAPSSVLVEVMKTLAWRGLLSAALSTTTSSSSSSLTSSSLWPIEVCLRSGNAGNVLELLQRTGYLAFPPLAEKRASLFHHAIVGGSSRCFEYVMKFVKKYPSGGERGAATAPAGGGRGREGRMNHVNMNFDNLIEWKDENGDTPFLLACSRSSPASSSASSHLSLIKDLLLSGANVAAVNSFNQFTGLMYAAANGVTDVVSLLLSIQDIPKSEQEVLDLVRRLGGIGGSSSRRVFSAGLVNYSSNFSSAASPYHHPDLAEDDLPLFSSAEGVLPSSDKKSSTSLPCPLSLAVFSSLPSHHSSLTGKSALHLAAEEGHSDIVLLLLKIGMSLSDVDKESNNIYHLFLNRLITRLEEEEEEIVQLSGVQEEKQLRNEDKRDGRSESDQEEKDSSSSSLLIDKRFVQSKTQKKVTKGKKGSFSAKEKSFLVQLLSVEKMKWQHYRKSLQPKGYENMSSPMKPLFTRNHFGYFPLDLAMKLERGDDEKSLSLLILEGMIDIYCSRSSSSFAEDPVIQVSDLVNSGKKMDFSSLKKNFAKLSFPGSVPPFSSVSFSSLDISKEMIEWLFFLKEQLTQQQVLSSPQEFNSDEILTEKGIIHQAGLSSSSVVVPDELETLVTRENPTSSTAVKGPSSSNLPGKFDYVRKIFTPFLLYRRKLSETSRLFHYESKEETMSKEEKDEKNDGITEERERGERTNEDEADTLEYMFALTPLALKTFHPIVNK